ncbi:MAG TPA: flagellar hook basal-body protein [Ignavibacteriales bacterium]|nr:flagellar hook basal-body protein [Ignavibacteriales bacterium]
MIKGMYFIAQNLGYKEKNMQIVANNLANINTTGFKRELPFVEIMTRIADAPVKQLTDLAQGNLIQTSNPLDLAVSGQGYFTVQNERGGLEYTRNGRFRISDDGFLVNEEGQKVMGKSGEIDLNDYSFEQQQSITITKNGEIKIGENVVDELLISRLGDPSKMMRQNGLNFADTEGRAPEAGEGTYEIQQGYLEESNTNPIIEMQSMIELGKDFETAQKMMNYLDESLGKATEIGKV